MEHALGARKGVALRPKRFGQNFFFSIPGVFSGVLRCLIFYLKGEAVLNALSSAWKRAGELRRGVEVGGCAGRLRL